LLITALFGSVTVQWKEPESCAWPAAATTNIAIIAKKLFLKKPNFTIHLR